MYFTDEDIQSYNNLDSVISSDSWLFRLRCEIYVQIETLSDVHS